MDLSIYIARLKQLLSQSKYLLREGRSIFNFFAFLTCEKLFWEHEVEAKMLWLYGLNMSENIIVKGV